jgi:nucleotide-binding universal stress UspA family protein
MSGFELGNDGPTSIVVGVDGTPTSLRALSHALGLARRQHARLVAVHVRDYPTAAAVEWDTCGDAAVAAQRAGDLLEAELRAEVRQYADEWGVPWQFVARRGDPVRELEAVAQECRADALVVGTSAGIGHKIAGSIPRRLVRRSGAPVTVVP